MDKLEILKKYFGFDKLKKEQEEIIDSILANKDTIGLLPTGFGKSITFQLPALILDGITIVISPLVALMSDQVQSLKKKGIRAEFLNSLLEPSEKQKIYRKLKYGLIDILYVSAERLENEYFLNIILKLNISLIVCDEAHTVLWSDDFRKSIGKINLFIKKLNKRPRLLALTATATNNTVEKIIECIGLENPKIVSALFDRKNIFYDVKRSDKKLNELIAYISKHKNELGIIYCLTIRNSKYVYEYLKNMGFKVGYYYGTLEKEEKEYMQYAFTNHEINIIVCTNAFGMGIDIPDIRYVIEYDLPSSIEDYLQQTGRCSRDGKYREAILLFSVNDIKTSNYFIENIEIGDKTSKELELIKKSKYKKLDKMIEFATTRKCLHKYVVEYFGQEYKEKRCNMCINCKDKNL